MEYFFRIIDDFFIFRHYFRDERSISGYKMQKFKAASMGHRLKIIIAVVMLRPLRDRVVRK